MEVYRRKTGRRNEGRKWYEVKGKEKGEKGRGERTV